MASITRSESEEMWRELGVNDDDLPLSPLPTHNTNLDDVPPPAHNVGYNHPPSGIPIIYPHPLHQTPPSTSIILTISTASQQLQPQSTQLMRPSHSRPASSRPGSPGIRKYAPFIYFSFRHIHRPCLLHFLLSYRFSSLPTRRRRQ